MNPTFSENLQWRYAAKRMNGTPLHEQELSNILEAIRLAPSSRGLQPYKIVIISDPGLKAALQPIADHQPQIVECSHLLIFASWRSIDQEQIDAFIRFAAQERGISVDKLQNMKHKLEQDQLRMDAMAFKAWADRQTYIALAFGLLAAANQRIDACPMEGFDPVALDLLLDLESKGLASCVLLALGQRDKDKDWLVNLKKVRRSHAELFLSAP